MVAINPMDARAFHAVIACLAVVFCGPAGTGLRAAEPAPDPLIDRGRVIYQERCVRCHGPQGEGVPDKCKEPLRGDERLSRLARIIHKTMPDDDPSLCVDADAEAVARYIYGEFYAPDSRLRRQEGRVELTHLTVNQFLHSVADLVGGFRGEIREPTGRGLAGEYFASRNFRGDARAFRRVDAVLDFDWGEATPDPEKITTNEFSMRWRGSVRAPETGDYTFIVTSANGFRLWVNDGEKPRIDAWVHSGTEPTEHRAVVRLLAGRAYPLRLECFKYKEPRASLRLEWIPPHGAREVIPARCLAPEPVRPTFVLETRFPPDDSSTGYPRGTLVTPAWQEAVTSAAIETAQYVEGHLRELAGWREGAPDAKARAKAFAGRLLERAFRRPLTPEEQAAHVEAVFAAAPNPGAAVKRCVLMAVMSPWFLYPDLQPDPAGPHAVASRLALALWDSLPDEALRRAAEQDRLRTPEQLRRQAERMLGDPRARAKLQAFFAHWLQLDHVESIAKDAGLFPEFDERVAADLRTSLRLFLDEIAWGENPDYRRLLTEDRVLLNRRLAAFYRLEWPGGGDFVWMELDREHRAGVLTHPYLLAAFAYPRSSSPIHRGVFLSRKILGRPLNPPPMAVAFNEAEFEPGLTMREKVDRLTRPDACRTCHSIINPLGFSLEHFDAVGRFRTHDGDQPVDAQSDYTTLDGRHLRLTGARDVATYAAENPRGQAAFVRLMVEHFLQQTPSALGPRTLEELLAGFRESGFHIRRLMAEIAVRWARHTPAAARAATSPEPESRDT
ncbi:MAG: DUF1592 domain-containing protein [Verrucomicrobia bacterium]|nr:MAG: DUF1592 domain-containing protein [Verrucomicrobiota bacterium]